VLARNAGGFRTDAGQAGCAEVGCLQAVTAELTGGMLF